MQRFFDIILSGFALVILSPLLIPVVILLRLTGEHEVFFKQNRVGKNGDPFGLLKFATMLKNSPNLATGTVTVRNDPRILPVGHFLRKTKINEIPQLINILLGDMSIIGPRPQTQRCFNAFPAAAQAEIITVRPGLSGIGSIVFRGEENMMHANADPERFYDDVIMPYKGALESWYVHRHTFSIYLLSISVTVWVLLFPRSGIVWRAFRALPTPPEALAEHINWPKVRNNA